MANSRTPPPKSQKRGGAGRGGTQPASRTPATSRTARTPVSKTKPDAGMKSGTQSKSKPASKSGVKAGAASRPSSSRPMTGVDRLGSTSRGTQELHRIKVTSTPPGASRPAPPHGKPKKVTPADPDSPAGKGGYLPGKTGGSR